MLRGLWLCLFGFCLVFPSFAEVPRVAPRPLASALNAAANDRWEVAATLAAKDGPVAADIIEWLRLREGLGDPGEVALFLARNGDWPGLALLRKKSEDAFADAPGDRVLAFFSDHAPQTGTGVLSYARALSAAGRPEAARKAVIAAWQKMDLTADEHDDFLAAHGAVLTPYHEKRLEMALWRGLKDAEQMLPLVDADSRALAETRRLIAGNGRQLDTRIAELPAAVRNAPGVAYAIFDRHIARRQTLDAIALILRQSRSAEGLGQPERWAGWRRYLARGQMRDGNIRAAYDLASVHGLETGSAYADLEWLSGYIALRYLDEPELALDHFQRFRAAVETPISLGRAGYWIGRAQEALGDDEAAAIAYAEGAAHQTSFYGLLAAERGGLPFDPDLAGDEPFPPWRQAGFTRSTVHEAAVLLLAAGKLNEAERFWMHLAESQDRVGIGQMGQMLKELDQPHLQVMLGKSAVRRGITLPEPYYALHPMTEMDLPVPMELALAIARRESEFDFTVVSGAGAMGLMQLMPGTAQEVARDQGLEHSRLKVRRDWGYNAVLGSHYLAGLGQRFNGNIVMVSVGYNAGPSRVGQWIELFGDPRNGPVINGRMDVIDWIEHIPFRETRNYVMRVAESLPVYRARLGLDPLPVPFSQELTGATIRPGG